MKKLIVLLAIAALVFISCAALADGDRIAFDAAEKAVNEGETFQIALIREGDAAGGVVTYTSSDPKAATVDENGNVTALKKGRTIITAQVKTDKKSYRAQMKLTVLRPVATISINTQKLPVYDAADDRVAPYLTVRENTEENSLPVLVLSVKKKLQLTAAVEPKDASNRNVTFASSDSTVFTTAKNVMTGVAPGEAILTVASEANPEVRTSFRVLVVQPVTKISFEISSPSVAVGGQITLTAKVFPENATMKDVIWSSGDGKFLTIDENGTVTGVKKGNGRVVVTAMDGNGARANINVKVTQSPESLSLSPNDITVDVGRDTPCKVTVMPQNTDNKKVIWSSSDESIARVDKNGRIKGISIGDCTVTCTSAALGSVTATVNVHVQQPVKKVAFSDKTAFAYDGEQTQLSWMVEPATATNSRLVFKSANERIATVDENGVVTGIKSGKTKITATTTDGSKRSATITVQIGAHVRGLKMVRRHAYIDYGETATAGAEIYPSDAINKNVFWESSDTSVVTCDGHTNHKMKLTGIGYGNAIVIATTEDGNFQDTLEVTVGNFDNMLTFLNYDYDNAGNVWLAVRNDSDFTITQIKAQVELWDCTDEVKAAEINTKNGSNKVDVVWSGTLPPGSTTGKAHWKMVSFKTPSCGMDMTRGQITVYSYQIDGDWIKTIRKARRPHKEWN